MGFGINYESNSGGDFLPILKFDAKAGRMFKVDRVQGTNGYESATTDITRAFKAVLDFENVEVGFMNFDTGGAPDFVLTKLGDPFPQKPSDKHRQGVRIMLKLAKECGGDVREISSVAKAALRGFDALHTAYEEGAKSNRGKLPVVVLKDTIPITTGEGARKSTNYSPVFEITGWVDRPKDLIFSPKSKGSSVTQTVSTTATPPSTGSTRADPPNAAAKAPEPELETLDDFG